jgi:hypothetical protein
LGQVLTPGGNFWLPKFRPALFLAMAASSDLPSPTTKFAATSTINGFGTGRSKSSASIAVINSQISPRSVISLPARHLMTTSQSSPWSSMQDMRHGLVRPEDRGRNMVAAWIRGMWIALMACGEC